MKSDIVMVDANTIVCDEQNNDSHITIEESLKSDTLMEATPKASTSQCPVQDAVGRKVLKRDEMACVHDVITVDVDDADFGGNGYSIQTIEICKNQKNS